MQIPELLVVGGKPYSGKSTIASNLAETNEANVVRHLSMGDRLRDISAGRVASQFRSLLKANQSSLKQHTAVPNEVAFGVFEEFLAEPADLVIIDGFPRYADQLEGFRTKIQELGTSLLAVCKVEVPDVVVHARSQIRGQRFDDVDENKAFVDKRLAEYNANTSPTLDALAQDYPCYTIDGQGAVAENVTTLQGIYRAHSLVRQ